LPEDGPNPHHPYRDHWEKQRAENEKPEPVDPLREHHDHLSALTWNKEGTHESN
jgi:hypothetical protein